MVGETLGSYRIARAIGEGGMGTVDLGEHTLLSRQAAIKVLRPEMCHRADLVTRFFNEARAASTVQHPGIVEIFDFGRRPDGSAFIVMELLHGESLAARLRRVGHLSEAQAASFGRKVCSGLAAAHSRGIIHRDIKPDNLFLVADAFAVDGERVKILDFGIAKLAAEQYEDSLRTRTGLVMGTPTYMAPEQCKGTGLVDHRADIYALGCVLYAMVCGRPPFVSEGMGELMAKHIYEPIPLPSSLAPVSPAFEEILLRALAKRPDDRYATAEELAFALELVYPTGAHAAHASARSSGAVPALGTPTPIDAAAALTTIAEGSLAERMGTGSPGEPSGSAEVPRTGSSSVRRRARWPLVAAGLVGAVALVYAITAGGGDAPAQDPVTATPAASVAPPASPDAPSVPVAAPDAPSAAADVPAVPDEPSVPAAAPELVVAPVTLRITSVPAGAEVYRMPGHARVGTTPFESIRPAAGGEAVFVIEMRGKRAETITLSTERDGSREVRLRGRATRKPAGEEGPLSPGDTLNPFNP